MRGFHQAECLSGWVAYEELGLDARRAADRWMGQHARRAPQRVPVTGCDCATCRSIRDEVREGDRWTPLSSLLAIFAAITLLTLAFVWVLVVWAPLAPGMP